MPEPLDLEVLSAIHCAKPGHGPAYPDGCTFCQLIAELRETRADRDAKFPGAPILSAEYMAMQARAERAEAERDAYKGQRDDYRKNYERAEAAARSSHMDFAAEVKRAQRAEAKNEELGQRMDALAHRHDALDNLMAQLRYEASQIVTENDDAPNLAALWCARVRRAEADNHDLYNLWCGAAQREEAAEARIKELETMVAETRSIPAHEMRD